MFDLAQLRCFVAVAETLHFGRGAARLHMTQPPLSRQVQLLERTIGAELFHRSSRSVQLAPAGASLLPQARRLLQLAEAAAADARRAASGEAGTLRLGFTGGSGYELLPRVVAAMKARMPGVDLLLRELRSREQIEALAAGRIDAGLLRLPVESEGIALQRVARDKLILALPETHPLARRRASRLEDLDGTELIMFAQEENRFLHDLVATLLRTAAVAPRIVQQVNQIHTAMGLVAAGVGLAIVPDPARHLAMRGVVLRSFRPALALRADLHLAWRPGYESPALARFRALILPTLAATD